MTAPGPSTTSVVAGDRSHHTQFSSAATDLSSGGALVILDNETARCGSCAVRASVSVPFPFGVLRQCAYHAMLGLFDEKFARKFQAAVSL